MDAFKIIERSKELVSELAHGGVNTEHIEMHVLDTLCDEILQNIGGVEKYDEVKSAMKNMFVFGCVSGKGSE
jgi:hypothetical protein